MNTFDTKILINSFDKAPCEKFIDVDFFQKYCKVDYFENNFDDKDYFLKFQEKIKSENYDFVITQKIVGQPLLFEQLYEITKLNQNTKFVILDVLFPGVNRDKEIEKEWRNNFIVISDYKTNEFVDSIEVPLLGVLNQDHITQSVHRGNPHLKYHQIINYHDFKNRPFDLMFKVGKPKINRLVLAGTLLKNKLKNSYTNISFSSEPNTSKFLYNVDIFWDLIFSYSDNNPYKFLDKMPDELVEWIKKVPIETNLGLNLSKTDIQYPAVRGLHNYLGYTADATSCAEIYMESITCDTRDLNTYKDLVAYTEKTFNNFFYYKIPLAVDSKNNIDYLKNIGFQFPIEPCYIDGDDTVESLYEKLNDWLSKLKKYNFREMWEEMFFEFPFVNPLHSNHLLYREFMYEKKSHRKTIFSKPQYLATYLFIENYLPEKLEKFIQWDYQTYLFLKSKNLIKNTNLIKSKPKII